MPRDDHPAAVPPHDADPAADVDAALVRVLAAERAAARQVEEAHERAAHRAEQARAEARHIDARARDRVARVQARVGARLREILGAIEAEARGLPAHDDPDPTARARLQQAVQQLAAALTGRPRTRAGPDHEETGP